MANVTLGQGNSEETQVFLIAFASLLKVLCATKGILKKIMTRGRDLPPRQGVYANERASQVCPRKAAVITALGNKKTVCLGERPAVRYRENLCSKSSNGCACAMVELKFAPAIILFLVAQVRIGDKEPSGVHRHRPIVYAASPSQLVACLAVWFRPCSLLRGQIAGATKVPLGLATGSAATLTARLCEVIVGLTAVEIGCWCLFVVHVSSAVQRAVSGRCRSAGKATLWVVNPLATTHA